MKLYSQGLLCLWTNGGAVSVVKMYNRSTAALTTVKRRASYNIILCKISFEGPKGLFKSKFKVRPNYPFDPNMSDKSDDSD